MKSELETHFPFRQLEDFETNCITAMLGQPPESPEPADNFMRLYGRPMIRHFFLDKVISTTENACKEFFRDIDSEELGQAFRKGVDFYAAVLAGFSPLDEVPCEPVIIQKIYNRDADEFIQTAHRRAESEVPSLCSLLRTYREVMELGDNTRYQLSLVGAGVVHIVASRSLRMRHNAAALEADFPELADLEELFQQMS